MRVITRPDVFAVIYWFSLALQVISCAPQLIASPRPHIGQCEMPPDQDGYMLIGCVAFQPDWTEASCMYVEPSVNVPELLTLQTRRCGQWSMVFKGFKP